MIIQHTLSRGALIIAKTPAMILKIPITSAWPFHFYLLIKTEVSQRIDTVIFKNSMTTLTEHILKEYKNKLETCYTVTTFLRRFTVIEEDSAGVLDSYVTQPKRHYMRHIYI